LDNDAPVSFGQAFRDGCGIAAAIHAHAAHLQFPADNPANAGVRDEFQLNTFPPDNHHPTAANTTARAAGTTGEINWNHVAEAGSKIPAFYLTKVFGEVIGRRGSRDWRRGIAYNPFAV